jgi:hypothetical protein
MAARPPVEQPYVLMSLRYIALGILALSLLMALVYYGAGSAAGLPLSQPVMVVKTSPPPVSKLSPPAVAEPISQGIDPGIQQLADTLNAPDSTPQRDLEVLREFMKLYARANGSGNPVGLNEDITAALTGTADPNRPGQLFPRSSRAIRNGQLIDRWGSPFYFHPESSTKMEIRSSGPDKQVFTPDDIILQP